MTKDDIIRKIQTFKDKKGVPYKYIRCTGGPRLLKEASQKQLFAMLKSLESRPVIGPVIEKQLELNFT